MSLRSKVIFLLALLFAAKALIRPDYASVCGLLLFIACHYVDRFFSDERVESKVVGRVKALEEAQKVLRDEMTRMNVNFGIRGSRGGQV